MIKMAKNDDDATRYHKCNQGNCVVRVMNVYILPSVSRPLLCQKLNKLAGNYHT